MANKAGRPKGATSNSKSPKAFRLAKNFLNMARVYQGFIKANIADGNYSEACEQIKATVGCLQNADKMLSTLEDSAQ